MQLKNTAQSVLHGIMRTILLILQIILGAATLASTLALIYFDLKLWSERRPGAPLWKLWVNPPRWWNANQYTPAGEYARRWVVRCFWLSVFLALAFLSLRGATS